MLWAGDRLLLRFLSAFLGVSRCIRPLLRLLRPGVAPRCCKALIVWGVTGILLVIEDFCIGRRAPGMRNFADGTPTILPRDVILSTLEVLLLGVDGFWISPARCRNLDERDFSNNFHE